MNRTLERLLSFVAIIAVAMGGYILTEVRTCEAINESHRGTQVFLDELVDAFGNGELDPENQARVDRIERNIQTRDCSWSP